MMTSALAPGYVVETRRVGGAMSGYSATGSLNREMTPVSTSTRLTTIARRGRSMKILENMPHPFSPKSAMTVIPGRTLWVPLATTVSPFASPFLINWNFGVELPGVT